MPRSNSPMSIGAIALLLSSGTLVNAASPTNIAVYENPMPIPTVAVPKKILNDSIDYYEMEIRTFTKPLTKDGLNATMVGYNGTFPGPTIMVKKNRETVVRFINREDKPTAIHLHGSPSRSPWDGWADDTIQKDEFKDYYYPNYQSARMLWYHDHAINITSENVNKGQVGAYIITDEAEDDLNLPSGPTGPNGGPKYDVPIILSTKEYDANGTPLVSGLAPGDVIEANGMAWPFFEVEPRKYRLRFLDAALSRSFKLAFQPGNDEITGDNIDFDIIASDAGLLTGPIRTKELVINPAERYEIVIDFEPFIGKNITLRNSDGVTNPKAKLAQVIRFVVNSTAATENSPSVPEKLRKAELSQPTFGAPKHNFTLQRIGLTWKIGGHTWDDGEEQRILANVSRGTVEQWLFHNPSTSAHPIHTHLIDFLVVKRTPLVAGGRNYVETYEKGGLKDVIWIRPNENVTVEAHYAPWDGLYMMHCHNLAHEDNKMIAAFRVEKLVEKLAGLGYDESDKFLNPMEQSWRPKAHKPELSQIESVEEAVSAMVKENPYKNVNGVFSALSTIKTGQATATAVPAKMARRWEA